MLGAMYIDGLGVPKHDLQAYGWISAVLANNLPKKTVNEATKHRDAIDYSDSLLLGKNAAKQANDISSGYYANYVEPFKKHSQTS